jgi:hypothetical protein
MINDILDPCRKCHLTPVRYATFEMGDSTFWLVGCCGTAWVIEAQGTEDATLHTRRQVTN